MLKRLHIIATSKGLLCTAAAGSPEPGGPMNHGLTMKTPLASQRLSEERMGLVSETVGSSVHTCVKRGPKETKSFPPLEQPFGPSAPGRCSPPTRPLSQLIRPAGALPSASWKDKTGHKGATNHTSAQSLQPRKTARRCEAGHARSGSETAGS